LFICVTGCGEMEVLSVDVCCLLVEAAPDDDDNDDDDD
jgi:hypothetical protein